MLDYAAAAMAGKPGSTFEVVKAVGLTLPDVESTIRYDRAPVLKVGGVFMAGLATHPSAEPETLVVRADLDDRAWLLEDAPETYYLTDYYRKYPLVLVRLARIDADALRDLLASSWRLALAKTTKARKTRKHELRATGSTASAPDASYDGAIARKARGSRGRDS